jgi:hypothetical protein
MKLKAIKTLTKKNKQKNKKLKVEGLNRKILYIQIKNQRVKLKTNKTLTKEKIKKIQKSKLEGLNLKYQ